jgi:hypothetical protein
MPWSGTGNYTRAYPSWTSDATNNLPISATKFDLEDNDFAAGIQNCLTIDGQNKPNTTLSWAQALALSKAVDATILTLSRTGGSNNPIFQISLADATGVTLNLTTAQQLALATNNANRLQISGAGNVVTNAPSAGVGLVVNGFAGSNAQNIVGSSSTGNSFGLATLAGTTASDYSLSALNQSGSISWFKVRGDGVVFGNDGTNPFELGYKDTPFNVQTVNYTLVASDRGKTVGFTAGGLTATLPAGVFAAGAVTSLLIGPGNTLTIAQGGGVTLQWTGNGSATGNRTLTGAGLATVFWASGTQAYIAGSGLS